MDRKQRCFRANFQGHKKLGLGTPNIPIVAKPERKREKRIGRDDQGRKQKYAGVLEPETTIRITPRRTESRTAHGEKRRKKKDETKESVEQKTSAQRGREDSKEEKNFTDRM